MKLYSFVLSDRQNTKQNFKSSKSEFLVLHSTCFPANGKCCALCSLSGQFPVILCPLVVKSHLPRNKKPCKLPRTSIFPVSYLLVSTDTGSGWHQVFQTSLVCSCSVTTTPSNSSHLHPFSTIPTTSCSVPVHAFAATYPFTCPPLFLFSLSFCN